MGGMASLLVRPIKPRPRTPEDRSALRTPKPMPPQPSSSNKADDQASGQDIIRGSTDVPLDAEGQREAERLGKLFKGKVTKIYTSDLKRARQTAAKIAEGNPNAPVHPTSGLRPWHLGELEGQPTLKVLDRIKRYAVEHPDKQVPGRGKLSTADGESFNQFSKRALGTISRLIEEYKSALAAGEKPVIVAATHYRDLRLLKSWFDRKLPADLSVEAADMIKHEPDDAPGTVHYFYQEQSGPDKGKWCLDAVGPSTLSEKKLDPGIYFVRHGKTALNGASA